jgi:predicted MFS family arabinose efflux permease
MNFAGFFIARHQPCSAALYWAGFRTNRPLPLDRRGAHLQVVGLLLITMVANLFGMICAGALFMAGNAIGSSTTLAFAVERADPARRGKAMATFSMAYPLSYGLGSLLAGSAVEGAGYVGMYLLLAALEAIGLIFLLMNGTRVNSNGPERV